MHTFFHGWRRKVGVATLVMACLMMGLWMRSRFILDTVRYCPDGRYHYSITLAPSAIRWVRLQGSGSFLSPRFFDFDWDSKEYSKGDDDPILDPRVGWQSKWNWQACGFQFGSFQDSSQSIVNGEVEIGFIPYWSLVLPLTALSAYLILWKPRKRVPWLKSRRG
jgi:hypothetical protein